MLLYIHNLPSCFGYSDIERLIREKCGVTSVILDDLVSEGSGSRVTVGLADEEDAAILARKINGFYFGENQLFVEDVRKNSPSDQPYRSSQMRQHNLNPDHMGKVVSARRPEPFAASRLQTAMHGPTYNNIYNNPVEQASNQPYRSTQMSQQNQDFPLGRNHTGNNVPAPVVALAPFAASYNETPMHYVQTNFTPSNGYGNVIDQQSSQPYRGFQMGQQSQTPTFNRDYVGVDKPPYPSVARAPLLQRPTQYDQTPQNNAYNDGQTGQLAVVGRTSGVTSHCENETKGRVWASHLDRFLPEAMYPITQAPSFNTTVNQAKRNPIGQQKYEPEDSLLPEGGGYKTLPSSRNNRYVPTRGGRGGNDPGRGNDRFESEKSRPRDRETRRPSERPRSPRYDAAPRDIGDRRDRSRRDVAPRETDADNRFAARRDPIKRPARFSDAGPSKPKHPREDPAPGFSSSSRPPRKPHQENRREPYTRPSGEMRPPVVPKNVSVPAPASGSALLTDLVKNIDQLYNTFGSNRNVFAPSQRLVRDAGPVNSNRFGVSGSDSARRTTTQHPINPWGADSGLGIKSGNVRDVNPIKFMSPQKLQNKDLTNRQTAVSEISKRMSYMDYVDDMTADIPTLKMHYKDIFLKILKSELRARVDRLFPDKLVMTKEEIIEKYEKQFKYDSKKSFKQICGYANIRFVAQYKGALEILDKNLGEWQKQDGKYINEAASQSDPEKMPLLLKWLVTQQYAIHNLLLGKPFNKETKHLCVGLSKLLTFEMGYHKTYKIDLRETLKKDTLSGHMTVKNVVNLFLQIVPADKNDLPDFDAMLNFLKPYNVSGLRRFRVLDMYLAYFETEKDLLTLKSMSKTSVDGKMVKFEPFLHNLLDPSGNILQDKLPLKSVSDTDEKGQDITEMFKSRLREAVKGRPKCVEDHLKVLYDLRTRVKQMPTEDANAKKLVALKAVLYRDFHYLEKNKIDKEQVLKTETLSPQLATYTPEDDNIVQIVPVNNEPLPNFDELNAFLQPHNVKGLRRFLFNDMYLALLATKGDCEKLYAMGATEVGSKRAEFKQFPAAQFVTVQANIVANKPDKQMPVSQIHESLIRYLKNEISLGKGALQTLKELFDKEMSYHRQNGINIEDTMMFDTFSKHLREDNTLDVSSMLIVTPMYKTDNLIEFNLLNDFLKPHTVIGLRKFLVIKSYVALFQTKQDCDKMLKLGTASIVVLINSCIALGEAREAGTELPARPSTHSLPRSSAPPLHSLSPAQLGPAPFSSPKTMHELSDGQSLIFKPFTEGILRGMLQSSKTNNKPKINKPVQKSPENKKNTNMSMNKTKKGKLTEKGDLTIVTKNHGKPTEDANKLSVTDTSSKENSTIIEKPKKTDGTMNDFSKNDSSIKEETLTVSKDSKAADDSAKESYEEDDKVEPVVDDKLENEDLDIDLDELEDY